MTRQEYMRSLSQLRDQVVQLSSMVDKAIARSTERCLALGVPAGAQRQAMVAVPDWRPIGNSRRMNRTLPVSM